MNTPKPHPDGRQAANASWWQENPMIYDNWRGGFDVEPYTPAWYAEIDRHFFNPVTSWFALEPGQKPFANLIPLDSLRGKRVLEIGCGSGAHARLLAESGCELTCIDITARGVEMTRKRLEIHGLNASVRQMDAERLEFPDESFDFIWSWGVIHHSADTPGVVREIHRVLRPGGEARLMVYHRASVFAAYATVAGVLYGRVFRMPYDDVLSSFIDGDTARFYTRAAFSRLLRPYFSRIEHRVFGQRNELIPLPGHGGLSKLKDRMCMAIPDAVVRGVLTRAGVFLFTTAQK